MNIEYTCIVCRKLGKSKEENIVENKSVCKYCRANESKKQTSLRRYVTDNALKSEKVREKIK